MTVRTVDELESDLETNESEEKDKAQLAANYVALWKSKKTDADREKVVALLKKDKKRLARIKPYLPQELADAVGGKTSSDSKLDSKLVEKAKKYKNKGLKNTKAFEKLIDDGADEKAAEAAVDSVYGKKKGS